MSKQITNMPEQINLWVNNQYQAFNTYPLIKVSKLINDLAIKGIYQFIIHEPINKEVFDNFIHAVSLEQFKVTSDNCYQLLDLSNLFEITNLYKFVTNYITNKDLVRPVTYYSDKKIYDFIIQIKIHEIKPIKKSEAINIIFSINNKQNSRSIMISKNNSIPDQLTLITSDFNSDSLIISYINQHKKITKKIRLIDLKIGETFNFDDYLEEQNEKFVRIKFKMDFIPNLRPYCISGIETLNVTNSKQQQIESNYETQIQQLKTQHDQELNQKNKEIQQLKHQHDHELNQKNKEIQKLKSKKSSTLNEITFLDSNSIKEYERIEEIDSGGSSVVYKVSMKMIYALKEMKIKNKTYDDFKRFFTEYEIMNQIEHPNILKTYGFFIGDKKSAPSIIFEYCPQNLNNAIQLKTLSKTKIVCCIYQIIEGMKYVHFLKVVHRDLKPSNILIAEDGTIKISDFGISKLMSIEEQTSMTHGIGTYKYMAPEIINEEKNYTEKVDVFSFGVLLYFVLNDCDITNIKIGDIFKGKKVEFPPSFTEFAKKLIDDCLSFDPKSRPSFIQICDLVEKNNYSLMDLEKNEISQIHSFVKNHKEKIPVY